MYLSFLCKRYYNQLKATYSLIVIYSHYYYAYLIIGSSGLLGSCNRNWYIVHWSIFLFKAVFSSTHLQESRLLYNIQLLIRMIIKGDR